MTNDEKVSILHALAEVVKANNSPLGPTVEQLKTVNVVNSKIEQICASIEIN